MKQRKPNAPKGDGSAPLSINALSQKTGADRSALKRLLQGVKPEGWEGENPLYTLRQVEIALKAKRETGSVGLRERKLEQEIRKLTLANDRAAGVLIPRALVAECMAKACAEWNKARIKCEQESPAQIRAKVKALTSRIGEVLADLGRQFEE